ncbi:PEP/pyruvate-binding domain-containing protein [Candidatus Babeliales bacterium]|nr:PEP/pyruvate-binding domain-containing protein [Candidatus Babeliales bacterium]
MNNKTIILFLWCFFCIRTSIPASITLNPEILLEKAEKVGLGYKAANLLILKNYITHLDTLKKTTGYSLQIPEFAVIPSHEVQQFFKKNKLALKKRWKKLLHKYSPATREQFVANKKFSEKFLHDLKTKIEKLIVHLFTTKQQTEQATQDFFVGLKQQTRNELRKVIEAAKTMNNKLVVRSTGKEDTETLANAGGNQTVLNVEPNVPALAAALTNVVASYFSSRSLTQRLNAGDPTLFDAPFTPALVQLMISEKPNDNNPSTITRCGVMFTQDPSSATSGSVNGKLGCTSGITLIQASYGLNEGVVNSTVPVDTFYVDQTNITHAIIRKKNFRLVPGSTSGSTEQKLNPAALIDAPALQQPAIVALKLLATALENFYQKPMDIEFVIDEAQKIIYIVQARPLVHNQTGTPPNWLDRAQLHNATIFEGATVSAANSTVRIVSNKEQVIIKETIGQALSAYHNVDPTTVQAIIIGTPAATTSHEATCFRSDLKPVIFLDQWQELAQQAHNKKTLLVDAQQSLVAVLEKPETFENLKQKSIVRDGWVCYPAPTQLSCLATSNTHAHTILDLDQTTRYSTRFLQNCLSTLATTTNATECRTTLSALLSCWHNALEPYQETVAAYDFLQQEYNALLTNFLSCADHVQLMLKHQPGSPLHIKRLLPIKALEALITQSPNSALVNSHSFTHFLKTVQNIAAIKHEKTSQQQVLLTKLGNEISYTPALAQRWSALVNALPTAALEQCANIIAMINSYNILELWFHTSASQHLKTIKEHSLEPEQAENIITIFAQEILTDHDFLETLHTKKTVLETMNLEHAADPATFTSWWHNVTTNILDYFVKQKSFAASFKTSQKLGRLAAVQLMQQLVSFFDNALKAVTSSNKFTQTSDKITTFKKMLIQYFALLQSWCYNLPNVEQLSSYSTKNKKDSSPKNLFIKVDTILQAASATDPNQLRTTTPGFNVANATIGSGANWERTHPNTLEEIFTFVHQSLLAVLSTLTQHEISLHNFGAIQQMHDFLLNKTNLSTHSAKKINVIGVDVQGPLLRINYSFPQRLHSALATLTFDKTTQTCSLQFSMIGFNHNGRWERCLDFLELKSMVKGIPLVKAEVLGQRFNSAWQWQLDATKPEKHILYLSDLFKIATIIAYQFNTLLGSNEDKLFDPTISGSIAKIYENTDRSESYLISHKNALPTPAAKKAFFDKAAPVVIHLSRHKHRAHWLLPQALAYIRTNPTLITNELFSEVVDIANKLATPDSDYALETEIFLYRKQTNADNGPNLSEAKKRFYQTTVENYYQIMPPERIQEVRGNANKNKTTKGMLALCLELLNTATTTSRAQNNNGTDKKN